MKGLVLSDLHFGIRNTTGLVSELQQVLTHLRIEDFDLVVIAGDYFNNKLSLNDMAGKLSLRFMDDLVQLSKEMGFEIRVVKGTNTHDLNQLDNFTQYISGGKFKLFNKSESEKIVFKSGEEVNILYLPEEYPENKKEYLESVSKNAPFDLVFGHGLIDFMSFSGNKQESEREISNPVVFDSGFLCGISKGPVIFGHVHTRCSAKNKIYYPGSFTRWTHGEENTKGYLTFEYQDGNFSVEFQDNLLAPKFNTLSVKDVIDIENSTLEEILINIAEFKKNSENIQLDLSGLPEDKKKLIADSYSEEDGVKIKEKKISLEDRKMDEEYLFILEDRLPLPEIISRYIKLKYNKDIDSKKIESLITKEN